MNDDRYLSASKLIPGMLVSGIRFAHPTDLIVISNERNTDPRWAEYARVVTFEDGNGYRCHWHYTPGKREDTREWVLLQTPEATE